MTPKKTTRVTTGRQRNANKANAQKSTGPCTAEGKQQSRLNAVTHGAFLTAVVAVPRGPFAEDPAAVMAEVDRLRSALGPRDAVEEAQATIIARLYLQQTRLDRVHTEAIADGSRLDSVASAQFKFSTAGILRRTEQMFDLMILVVNGGGTEDDVPSVAHWLRTWDGDAMELDGLWDDGHHPSSPAEWAEAVEGYVHLYWENRDQCLEELDEERCLVHQKDEDLQGQATELAARGVLQGPFDLATRYQGRLGRELERAINQYLKLQERDIDY